MSRRHHSNKVRRREAKAAKRRAINIERDRRGWKPPLPPRRVGRTLVGGTVNHAFWKDTGVELIVRGGGK